jgi:hypothetical protein
LRLYRLLLPCSLSNAALRGRSARSRWRNGGREGGEQAPLLIKGREGGERAPLLRSRREAGRRASALQGRARRRGLRGGGRVAVCVGGQSTRRAGWSPTRPRAAFIFPSAPQPYCVPRYATPPHTPPPRTTRARKHRCLFASVIEKDHQRQRCGGQREAERHERVCASLALRAAAARAASSGAPDP